MRVSSENKNIFLYLSVLLLNFLNYKKMKIKVLSIIVFLVTLHTASAQTALDKWPAIKEFHTVMSQTFHPAEEGNLEPIKARSQEMLTKADALLQSDIPAEFRTKNMLATIEKLEVGAKELHILVTSKADDTAITKAITALHDQYHQVVGMCSGSEQKK